MEYLGRYKLVERIAIGGMAEIFLAEQPGPAGFSRRVAIKRILPHRSDDADFVEMFLNEARLSALLNHPNIVQIYDLGEADGAYYIAMEFVDGVDLGQLLDKCEERRETLPAPYVARIISQAAGGLNYAHAYCDPQTNQPLNLIHRDISLPNIMLSKEGVIKLLDFGIAKAATTEQRAPTQTGVLKGKISYMSPEYLMGEKIDWRHDLFALGVLMFELATGEKPFQAKGDVQMLQAILTQPPQDPTRFNPSLPRPFVDIAMRMLAKDPRERFQNGAEIQNQLEQFIFDYAGGEITHGNLARVVQALFQGQPIPNPSLMANQKSARPHTPPTSDISAFSSAPMSPQPTGAFSSNARSSSPSSGGWMEETRAIAINTASLQGAIQNNQSDFLGNPLPRSEQTALLQIDALETTLDRSGGLESFDVGQPLTAELDVSMLPPPPDTTEEPLTPIEPSNSMRQEAPGLKDVPSDTFKGAQPEAKGTPKWIFLVIPLCLLGGGLSVLGWKLLTDKPSIAKGTEPQNVADAGAGTTPARVTPPIRNSPPPRPPDVRPTPRVTKAVIPVRPPNMPRVKSDAGGDMPPLPSFANGGSRTPPVDAGTNGIVPPNNNQNAPPARRYEVGVYLKSYPSCTVFWRGQNWGTTPVELPLTPGTHNLILRRSRPYIRYPYQINLQEGEYLQKTVYIREGYLDIRVTPDARVTIDGHYIGQTPLSPIQLYAGYHNLYLYNEKLNRRLRRFIFIRPNSKLRLRLRMK